MGVRNEHEPVAAAVNRPFNSNNNDESIKQFTVFTPCEHSHELFIRQLAVFGEHCLRRSGKPLQSNETK